MKNVLMITSGLLPSLRMFARALYQASGIFEAALPRVQGRLSWTWTDVSAPSRDRFTLRYDGRAFQRPLAYVCQISVVTTDAGIVLEGVVLGNDFEERAETLLTFTEFLMRPDAAMLLPPSFWMRVQERMHSDFLQYGVQGSWLDAMEGADHTGLARLGWRLHQLFEAKMQHNPHFLKRCVYAVAKKNGGDSDALAKAFAVCTAQAQKHGWVKPGTGKDVTKAGMKHTRSLAQKPSEAGFTLDRYERLLARARKNRKTAR